LAIEVNPPIPPNAGDGPTRNHVPKGGRSTTEVFRGGSYVHQPTFTALQHPHEPMAYTLGDGVRQCVQTLIPRAHDFSMTGQLLGQGRYLENDAAWDAGPYFDVLNNAVSNAIERGKQPRYLRAQSEVD
jgi:hypothetical protein